MGERKVNITVCKIETHNVKKAGVLNYMKKIMLYILIIAVTITTTLMTPFVIEKIVANETTFPFNIQIEFGKEVWFGFIGSYLGAIGTIFLGIIALVQNKRYKELADESNDRVLSLQAEIRDLNEKTVKLIELNSKMEHAKFYPKFTDLHHTIWNSIRGQMDSKEVGADVFQLTFDGVDIDYFYTASVDEIYSNYFTFTYLLKNDSEHSVKNFICKEILVNNEVPEYIHLLFRSCDISAGNVVACTYIAEQSWKQEIIDGNIRGLTFIYEMENGIGERYEMETQLFFLVVGEGDEATIESHIEVTYPTKKSSEND